MYSVQRWVVTRDDFFLKKKSWTLGTAGVVCVADECMLTSSSCVQNKIVTLSRLLKRVLATWVVLLGQQAGRAPLSPTCMPCVQLALKL